MAKKRITITLSFLWLGIFGLLTYNNCSQPMEAIDTLDLASLCAETKITKLKNITDEKTGDTILTGFFMIKMSMGRGQSGDVFENTNYYLKFIDGSDAELIFPKSIDPMGIPARSRIRVIGRYINGDKFQVYEVKTEEGKSLAVVELLSDPETASLIAPITETGTKNTLVLIADFAGGDNRCLASAVESAVFSNQMNSLHHYYQSMSEGRLGFEGVVIENIDLASSNPASSCDVNGDNDQAWRRAMETEAIARGHSPNNYDYVIYILPIGGCKRPGGEVGGYAFVGGDMFVSYYCSGQWMQTVMAHEMGHSLGMLHAGRVRSGRFIEYGDYSDVMGNGGMFRINAPHSEDMHWMPRGKISSYNVSNLTQSIEVELESLDLPYEQGDLERVLKLTHGQDNYYLSLRVPGSDYTAYASTYRNKVSIHQWPTRTPEASSSLHTAFLGSLEQGDSFDGPNFEASVIQLGSTARIRIRPTGGGSGSGGEGCTENTPRISVSRLGNGGNTSLSRSLQISIMNQDSGATCGQKQLSLGFDSPSSLIDIRLSQEQIHLNPGQIFSIIADVNMNSNLTQGAYVLSFSASMGNQEAIENYSLIFDPPNNAGGGKEERAPPSHCP